MSIARRLLGDQSGYGTVELLVLVAALGTLATVFMTVMRGRVETSGGNVADQVDSIVNDWTSAE